ncbi:hypothetical protein [uncultured Oscillibacter sp.]|uniref:hypothetical protein n=1 Tax=uncultured Oscillibacter sp. TaxID=876091 RepID=UPI00266F99C5|nr:hypothetical protein [uncultured Oscillibacter sp.]
MRIENALQARPEYRKTTASATPSKTFGQVMQTAKAQDRYVPSTPQPRSEPEFSLAERTYYGSVTVSNATQAKLKQLAEIDRQADYTGMSPEEIYAEIWNRYDEAFGGDMIAIKGYIAGPAEWCVVNNQFCDEVTRHIFNPAINAAWKEGLELDGRPYTEWTYEEKTALDRLCMEKADKIVHDAMMKTLGYDGMSFDERETAIREKYAGKNTTLDFLNLQSELSMSGVLIHKMGMDRADTYLAMMRIQFDEAFNPNSIYNVGHEKCSMMTADQWYRVADQPFDTAQFAAAMKDNLHRVSGHNGWTEDYVKLLEGLFDHFITGAADDGLDSLLDAAIE